MLSTRARLASRVVVGASIRRTGNRGLTHQPPQQRAKSTLIPPGSAAADATAKAADAGGGSAAKPHHYNFSPDTIVLGVGLGGLILGLGGLIVSSTALVLSSLNAKIEGQDKGSRFLKGQDLEMAVLGSKMDEDYWKGREKERRAAVLRRKNDEKKNDEKNSKKRFWFWPW